MTFIAQRPAIRDQLARRAALRAALVALPALACSGSIDGAPGGGADDPRAPSTGRSDPGRSTGAEPAALPGAPSVPGAPSPAPLPPGAPTGGGAPNAPPAQVPFTPGPGGLRRLTGAELAASLRDVFGLDVADPAALEPDDHTRVFTSIAAYTSTAAQASVERQRDLAFAVAARVFGDAAARERLLGCAPTRAADPCVRPALARLGRRLFRRTLPATELDTWTGLVATTATQLGDVAAALQYAVAAMLQSPRILYLIEVGEPAGGKARRLTGSELATRLAFGLTGSTPDDALLDAAERGELATTDGVRTQALRLLATPRAKGAVTRFFGEHLHLAELDDLVKDTARFPGATAELFAAMRREIELSVVDLFEKDLDVRQLLDARSTFVNRRLAAFYGLPAPSGTGFTAMPITEAQRRHGLLTYGGLLALNAHASMTSPTRRGVFVLERLLCRPVPEPPSDVDTSGMDKAAKAARSGRQFLEEHVNNPVCAACHTLFDPVGFALESYDAVGAYRAAQPSGAPFDVSGQLDGARFAGPVELAAMLRNKDELAPCLAQQAFQAAAGHDVTDGERSEIAALGRQLEQGGWKLRPLLAAIAASPAFRHFTPAD